MVKNVQYTSVRRVLEDILDHPLLSDVTIEQVVRYAIRFMHLHGMSAFYQDKIEDVEIKDYRGMLPCDLVSVTQVKDLKHNVCLRSMTDNFTPGQSPTLPKKPQCHVDGSFKTQGQIIYTSFPEGCVRIAYKAVPIDEDGFPMVIDNENYLAALEAYIKKQIFTVKFDTGKVSPQVLRNAQIEYGDLCDLLRGEFLTPSISEMQSITNIWTSLIPRMSEFYNGFKREGSRELLRRH